MKNDFAVRSVPIAALAQSQQSHSGSLPLQALERLAQESQHVADDASVHYRVRGALREDAAGQAEPWITLSASTELTMVCQRCMGPMQVALAFDRDFRFVASEDLAAVEDEESEEDVLAISKAFDLQALIEDELLMAMPIAPMHVQCPTRVKLSVADPDFAAEEAPKPHPFAVLQQLKSGK